MKKQFWILSGIVAVLFAACDNQSDQLFGDVNLAKSVSGVYSGTMTNSQTGLSRDATLTVNYENDSLVSMHWKADDFDTTMMMRLYQNYDSVMVCSTGDDFYRQYGHNYQKDKDYSHSMDKDSWMGMGHNGGCNCWAGNDQWNAWTNHINTQHDQDDDHLGRFDTRNRSCQFDIEVDDGNHTWMESFSGVKKSS